VVSPFHSKFEVRHSAVPPSVCSCSQQFAVCQNQKSDIKNQKCFRSRCFTLRSHSVHAISRSSTLFHVILWGGEGGTLFASFSSFAVSISATSIPLFSQFTGLPFPCVQPGKTHEKHTPGSRKHTKHTMKSRKHTETHAFFFTFQTELKIVSRLSFVPRLHDSRRLPRIRQSKNRALPPFFRYLGRCSPARRLELRYKLRGVASKRFTRDEIQSSRIGKAS
jgi:hypothetical protein